MNNYLIDIEWFNHIHCRHPKYICINFIEFLILNNSNDIIDSVKLYCNETTDGRFYKIDRERYNKIRSYMKGN